MRAALFYDTGVCAADVWLGSTQDHLNWCPTYDIQWKKGQLVGGALTVALGAITIVLSHNK